MITTFCIAIMCIVLVFVASFVYYTNKMLRNYKQQVKLLNERIKKENEQHNLTLQNASETLLGEACLVRALDEIRKDPETGLTLANEWLKKRQQILNEIKQECEKQNTDKISEVYDSALRIAKLIYEEKLNVTE
jgi:radical SAM superfamily enzyme